MLINPFHASFFSIYHMTVWEKIPRNLLGMILQIKTFQHYTIFLQQPKSSGELPFSVGYILSLIFNSQLLWEHFNSTYCEESQVLACTKQKNKIPTLEAKYTL